MNLGASGATLLVALLVLLFTFFDWVSGYEKSKPRFLEPFIWYRSLLLRCIFGIAILMVSLIRSSLSQQMKYGLWALSLAAIVTAFLSIVILDSRRPSRKKKKPMRRK